jgi:hypothetical protein
VGGRGSFYYSLSVILAAGLLILVGLGLFVGGILTGATVLYWACVAACVVAGVLLILAWRRMPAKKGQPATAEQAAEPTPTTTGTPTEESAGNPPGRPAAAAGPRRDTAARAAVHVRDPGVEEVEVTDLLVVVDLKDEVLVVDEHPRYHVAECSWLVGRETIPLPLDEARTDGFTPCAVCSPDRTLAERARTRK